ncbi:TRAP transporter small permease subunit [Kushneria phosphatilytica]|uniref:TRAP transporter small permease protein n=1 Tax=Kushneria phosphatilytica TaxID=657387 RepID=A0A1S1NY05_9GAMM|nr:TRAP transporter small permease [Kushneria phosphatilytica]OHV12755.1 TRAP transporter small permease protein [Kushneria phosphatilytica]QEL10596.1 TRAP transporter small permease [Kushneria phosphatilytica]
MTALLHACDRLVALTRLLSRWAARLIGLALLAVVAFVTLEVIRRKLTGESLDGVQEYSGYMLAILSSWGLAHTLIEKAHIRIDLGYSRLPTWLQAVLDLVAISALNLVSWLIMLHAWPVLATSLHNHATANTPLSTPLWIPQLIWVLGYSWFALTTSVLGVRSLLAALMGDRPTLTTLIGMNDETVSSTDPDPSSMKESR